MGQRLNKTYIDTIRAFSVCLIVLFHFGGYAMQIGSFVPIGEYKNGNWGNIGVFLFFMISGNVLMYRYGDNINLWKYYKNRFLKIFPAFWLCYAGAFLLNFWQNKAFPEIPLYKFILTVVGMDGFLAYRTQTFYLLGEWFLGSIIIIYLIFPLLRICILKNKHLTILALLVLNILLYYDCFSALFMIPVRRNIIVGLFYFVLGIWLEDTIAGIKSNKMKLVCFLLLCTGGCVFLTIKLPINEYIGALIVTAFIYVFIMWIDKYLSASRIILAGIQLLSKNSYIIYLLHHIIIQKVFQHFTGAVFSFKGIFCIFVICVVIIAFFTGCVNKVLNKKT